LIEKELKKTLTEEEIANVVQYALKENSKWNLSLIFF
jgi:hypothetical protein